MASPGESARHLDGEGESACPVRGEAAWRFFHRFRWEWWLLGPILAADIAGMLYGWYYYTLPPQIAVADPFCASTSSPCQPVWVWPLVADSPNAVLLFFVAAIAYRLGGWRHKVLDGLAFALNIYVGLWTTMLFLSYPDQMRTFEPGSTNNVLFVTHMGMPLQSLTLVWLMRGDRWGWKGAAAMLAFFALFVVVDYWGPHMHPAPALHEGAGDQVVGMPGDGWLAVASPILMAVAAGAWLAVARPWARQALPVPAGTTAPAAQTPTSSRKA